MMTKKTIRVIRKNLSPYHNPAFREQEKIALESIAGINYFTELAPLTPKAPTIWLTNTHTVLPPLSSAELQGIELIIHPNSGYDNFDSQWVKAAPFPIIVGNPIRAQAVAQYILSTLLCHFSGAPWQKKWDSKRKWTRTLISEKNILIMGYGHIGKILAQSLTPLAKNITIYDPFKGYKKLPELAQQDIIIPVAGLNKSSEEFIDQDFLNQLPRDFVLINAARGKLIDLNALLLTLKKSPQAFAYLDVFPQEPFALENFSELKNIKTTSHIAGVYSELDAATIAFEEMILRAYTANSLDLQPFRLQFKDLLLQNRMHPDMHKGELLI